MIALVETYCHLRKSDNRYCMPFSTEFSAEFSNTAAIPFDVHVHKVFGVKVCHPSASRSGNYPPPNIANMQTLIVS